MSKDIAIIGIACRLPGANSLEQFYQVLSQGLDCVTPVSQERILNSTLVLDPKGFQPFGWIPDVDLFDHKFFNVSLREAQQVDPQQRLMMTVAHECLESSGYAPSFFEGSDTQVIASSGDYQYSALLDHFEPAMYSGNTPFSAPGRVARQLNTLGTSFLVDTGCSSNLLAISLACDQLSLGNCRHALVVGARVMIRPLSDDEVTNMGTSSRDGKTRTFSDDAEGSGSAEGATAVLLKPLEQALADDDHVFAVVKSAVSNSAARSAASLTATSSRSQTLLLLDAWRKAGADPETIEYIEVHGSATRIGDPIEVRGIDDAFRQHTERKGFCAVSCVKTNIGHGGAVAGSSGLLKAVLSLRKGELFPSLHYSAPNPFINFDDSAVYVNDRLQPWKRKDGPRRCGVSSFGFAGNNVHVVLEEAPARPARPWSESSTASRLATLSSKRPDGVRDNMRALAEFLRNADEPDSMADIAFTLNTGRDHYRYRFVTAVESRDQFLDSLDKALDEGWDPPRREPVDRLYFVFSGSPSPSQRMVDSLCRRYEQFRLHYRRCESLLPQGLLSEGCAAFAFQYAFCRLLQSQGVSSQELLGIGSGELAADAVLGDISLQEGIAQAAERQADPPSDLRSRLAQLVERETEDQPALFLEMGPEGTLSRILRQLQQEEGIEGLHIVSLDDCLEEDPLAPLLQSLYGLGASIDWKAYHQGLPGRRIYLPGYQFERIRCWIRPPHSREDYQRWRDALADPELAASLTSNGDAQEGFDRETPVRAEQLEAYSVDESWTDSQKAIGRTWMDVLKIESVGLDDDFFALGGHSLLLTMVSNRLESAWGIQLETQDMFAFSTIRGLARELDRILQDEGRTLAAEAQGDRPDSIPVLSDRQDLPLSFAQQRVWFLDQLQPGAPEWNLPFGMQMQGLLDQEALERSLSEIRDRHETLRTTFENRLGRPMQVIHPAAGRFPLPMVDLQGLEKSLQEETVQRLSLLESRRAFHLAQGPLLRVTLLRRRSDLHVLLLTMHHIVSDGWSLGIFVEELSILYSRYRRRAQPQAEARQSQALPKLPVQYADFALWQRGHLQGPRLDRQLDYWKEQLADAPPVLELPGDFPSQPATLRGGGMHGFLIQEDLAQRFAAAAQDRGATLFMALLSAWAALLSRLSGQDDVVTGTPIAARNRLEIEPLIGFFLNTLAIRCDLGRDPSFETLLDRLKKACVEAFSHQDLPFEQLVDALQPERRLDRPPIFQNLFILQNAPTASGLELPGLDLKPLDVAPPPAKFDLSLSLTEEGSGITANLSYRSDWFAPASVERIGRRFVALLQGFADDPGRSLYEIDLFAPGERRHLLASSLGPSASDLDPSPLHERVAAQARRSPQAIALEFQGAALTYSQVEERSNRVAQQLQRLGVGPEDTVALFMGRSLELPTAQLGTLKAGAAFCVLDPELPRDRLQLLLDRLQPAASILDPLHAQRFPAADGPRLELDGQCRLFPEESPDFLPRRVHPQSLACIYFTSGSSGEPKAVAAQHQALSNYLATVVEDFALGPQDRISQIAAPNFDASLRDLFAPLMAGARTLLLSDEQARRPRALIDSIESAESTCLLASVPSMLAELVNDALSRGIRCRSVRLVLTAGERLGPELCRKVAQVFGPEGRGCRLINQYGTTETVLISSWQEVDFRDARPPGLGRPIADVRLLPLDHRAAPVPQGIPGSLHIAGRGVARGYVGQPAQTAARFLPDPFSQVPGGRMYCTGDRGRTRSDGALEFLGREDRQVKLRGIRLEPSEIESALMEAPGVDAAAVVLRREKAAGPYLAAYLQAQADAEESQLESQRLRAFLETRLPAYMIPSHYVEMERLPRTASGKLDRKRLPAPQSHSGAPLAARNDLELRLLGIWREVLESPTLGIGDNFFEAGGHSLLGVRLIDRIGREAGAELPLSALLESPTVERMARRLARSSPSGWTPLVAIRPLGSGDDQPGEPPVFCLHPLGGTVLCFQELAQHLAPAPVYAFQAPGLEAGQQPLESIEEMASLYLPFLKRVWPQGPYRLIGYSLGGMVAYEMARRLQAQGSQVSLLGLLDSRLRSPQSASIPSDEQWRCEEEAELLLALMQDALPLSKSDLVGDSPQARLRFAAEKARQCGALAPDVGLEQLTRLLKLYRTHLDIRYDPQPFPGKAVFLRAEDEPEEARRRLHQDWEPWIKAGLEVVDVPGAHQSLLDRPYASGLAAALKRVLHEVDQPESELQAETAAAT